MSDILKGVLISVIGGVVVAAATYFFFPIGTDEASASVYRRDTIINCPVCLASYLGDRSTFNTDRQNSENDDERIDKAAPISEGEISTVEIGQLRITDVTVVNETQRRIKNVQFSQENQLAIAWMPSNLPEKYRATKLTNVHVLSRSELDPGDYFNVTMITDMESTALFRVLQDGRLLDVGAGENENDRIIGDFLGYNYVKYKNVIGFIIFFCLTALLTLQILRLLAPKLYVRVMPKYFYRRSKKYVELVEAANLSKESAQNGRSRR
ncbi:MAG: hypothetical protein WDZ83_02760 [Rhizobiaceae bacterium]